MKTNWKSVYKKVRKKYGKSKESETIYRFRKSPEFDYLFGGLK
jgi:poly-D-alanine transfer protein DltD